MATFLRCSRVVFLIPSMAFLNCSSGITIWGMPAIFACLTKGPFTFRIWKERFVDWSMLEDVEAVWSRLELIESILRAGWSLLEDVNKSMLTKQCGSQVFLAFFLSFFFPLIKQWQKYYCLNFFLSFQFFKVQTHPNNSKNYFCSYVGRWGAGGRKKLAQVTELCHALRAHLQSLYLLY